MICWRKAFQPIDTVINSNPVPPFYMKMLVGIVIAKGFGIGSAKISALTFC